MPGFAEKACLALCSAVMYFFYFLPSPKFNASFINIYIAWVYSGHVLEITTGNANYTY